MSRFVLLCGVRRFENNGWSIGTKAWHWEWKHVESLRETARLKQRRRKLRTLIINYESLTITFILLAFQSSKTWPKTRLLRSLTFSRNVTTRRAIISSAKVHVVTPSSSSRKVKCELPFVQKINSKRSSLERSAKVTSSVKKLYKGKWLISCCRPFMDLKVVEDESSENFGGNSHKTNGSFL